MGAALGFKTGENKKVLRIYGFEGEPGGRGRCGRGSANQNVAGWLEPLSCSLPATARKIELAGMAPGPRLISAILEPVILVGSLLSPYCTLKRGLRLNLRSRCGLYVRIGPHGGTMTHS